MEFTPLSDTHPAIEALLIKRYRELSPNQKIEHVRAMTAAVQELALSDIRRRHPQAGAREQTLRLASRWIEPELMRRAFGWDVRTKGYWWSPIPSLSSPRLRTSLINSAFHIL
jgi:hypothetical protein